MYLCLVKLPTAAKYLFQHIKYPRLYMLETVCDSRSGVQLWARTLSLVKMGETNSGWFNRIGSNEVSLLFAFRYLRILLSSHRRHVQEQLGREWEIKRSNIGKISIPATYMMILSLISTRMPCLSPDLTPTSKPRNPTIPTKPSY